MTVAATGGPTTGPPPGVRARLGRGALAVLVGAALVAGCGDDDGSSSSSGTTAAPSTSITAPATTTTAAAAADPEAWAAVDEALGAMGTHVGLLAARVTDGGTCEPVHELEASTARPTGSQFKLWVLGALAERIAAGELSWDQELVVENRLRSLGNAPDTGALQFAEPDARVTILEAATKMISISDNTATDLLLDLLGREAVEAQVDEWTDSGDANRPFLSTRQMFLLHYAAGLGERYLALPPAEREAFLESEVDTLDLGAIATGYSDDPRFIHEIEWFASPDDLCRTFAGLLRLADDPALSAELDQVLSVRVAGLELDPDEWTTLWYKGGSEPGVLAVGWLATNADGERYVVQAMVSNPDAVLADTSLDDIVAVSRDAFALLAGG